MFWFGVFFVLNFPWWDAESNIARGRTSVAGSADATSVLGRRRRAISILGHAIGKTGSVFCCLARGLGRSAVCLSAGLLLSSSSSSCCAVGLVADRQSIATELESPFPVQEKARRERSHWFFPRPTSARKRHSTNFFFFQFFFLFFKS